MIVYELKYIRQYINFSEVSRKSGRSYSLTNSKTFNRKPLFLMLTCVLDKRFCSFTLLGFRFMRVKGGISFSGYCHFKKKSDWNMGAYNYVGLRFCMSKNSNVLIKI